MKNLVSFVSKPYRLAPLFLLPSLAFAHPGHDVRGGMYEGLVHPIMGIDHLLAMIAVGIWAIRRGGALRWLAPATFVTCMLMGTLLGASNAIDLHNESLLAGSVMALGLGIVFAARIPATIGSIAIGAFAIIHGFTHGAEATHGVDVGYVTGVLLATTALHVIGIALALALQRSYGERTVQGSGLPIAAAGVALLLS